MGFLYEEGVPGAVPRDAARAARFYTLAAEQGDAVCRRQPPPPPPSFPPLPPVLTGHASSLLPY